MSTHLTVFTATLVQDSALSVSGVDRESASDQPFAIVDGGPVLVGRGLKGAAVAMARRFFEPLPRSISEDSKRRTALQRSAWELTNARPAGQAAVQLRSGVGILQKTSARADGVLFDREVVCAGTRWNLVLRVNWRLAKAEAEEAEGILGYVLSEHWKHGRCWLGGGVARGLGWCHLENLRAYRLDAQAYETWVTSGRRTLPSPEIEIPTVKPTRSWSFHTRDVVLRFGEYRPDPQGEAWGLDMLAIGPHDSARSTQPAGSGAWARPPWAAAASPPLGIATERALLMEGQEPLIPGASVRGPLRHMFSRRAHARGEHVTDPHSVQGDVGDDDSAGRMFGTIKQSSSVLIRDGRAEPGWTAARLHMHAEDELAASSYSHAKRDAVRVLSGTFPVRIVVEGPDSATVSGLTTQIDRLVALGALGHLPVGGHKTRGAGWGRWEPGRWVKVDELATRSWKAEAAELPVPTEHSPTRGSSAHAQWRGSKAKEVCVTVTPGHLDGGSELTLREAAAHAQEILKDTRALWWCEPTIDFSVTRAPPTFGREWPIHSDLRIDEVAFFTPGSMWRAARTATGWRTVHICEVSNGTQDAAMVTVRETPARLHGDGTRFAAADTGRGRIVIREWCSRDQIVGYTLTEGNR